MFKKFFSGETTRLKKAEKESLRLIANPPTLPDNDAPRGYTAKSFRDSSKDRAVISHIASPESRVTHNALAKFLNGLKDQSQASEFANLGGVHTTEIPEEQPKRRRFLFW